MAALASGLGSIWDPQVNTPNITGPLSLCLNQLYVWTSVWIKCSIISLLKSFRREVTAWQWTLECLRVVIFLAAISAIFVQFFQCHPLRASWDFSLPRSACAGFSIYRYFLVSISCEYAPSVDFRACLTNVTCSHFHLVRRCIERCSNIHYTKYTLPPSRKGLYHHSNGTGHCVCSCNHSKDHQCA